MSIPFELADDCYDLGYGLTEMSPVCNLLPYDHFQSKAGSVGLLVPNLEARLVGDSGVDVKEGEPGELWLRGPTVMKVNARSHSIFGWGLFVFAQGYLNNPAATNEAITADGWYRSGDVCTRDPEGFFHIVDRIKELIKYKARASEVPHSIILVHEYSPLDLGLPRCN